MAKLLVINPNISDRVSALIESEARRAAAPDTEITMLTAPFGVEYIEARSEAVIGGYAVLDLVAEAGANYDAIVVAAFGDPGVAAAKEIAPCPVIGISEAAFATAGLRGGTFTIIAISARITAWYGECVRFYHAEGRLARIRSLSSSLRDIGTVQTDHAEQLLNLCRLAVEEDGADSIILAGAPLAGLGREISNQVPVPLIDGVASGIVQAEALARLGHLAPTAGSMIPPGRKQHKGLSPGLAKFFENERGT